MTIDLDRFTSMESYTFDEGVALLNLCNAPKGVVMHIAATHNRNHLHSEIHKTLRLPGTMRLLKSKGCFRAPMPSTEKKDTNPTEHVHENEQTGTCRNDNVPENDKTGTDDDNELTPEETDIIITTEDVRSHRYTRLEQMPNELTRQLWLKKQEVYREMQQNHLKMRNVPEGEEHDEERAKYRAEVLRLDAAVDAYWKQIDAEIERFISESERADKKADKTVETPGFDISIYRAYISKALRKKELTPAQLAELQHRVDALMEAKMELKPETIGKLQAKGIKVG